ncbi:CatB-related O-acetyltransferase [Flavobacterium frigoris]|uniref:Acetyltransferase (Isoleucine patch superfamily) n=1 Tax=Flavobacterium frigoris TaxID=229204 RepID=A0A1H9QZV4_FLAFI|nr:CatB-related O-acetyltransferase [Flavobacterium frigoris]SER65359.1 Acetyltransferase (isoleucine patch superfamily) [Flavobacterium frigoris]
MINLFFKKVIYYFLNIPEKKGKVLLSGFSRGLQNVIFEGRNIVPDRCNFSGIIKIGYATTLGYNNLLGGDITIGKYCQLGADVALHATNHPISFMSTYINSNLFDGELKQLKENNKIVIGNDVWIGHGVIIVGNVTVGNGAILAAGAVVTKDVLPYSVVAGVPARDIRKRFSDAIITEIEALNWWDKSEKELAAIKPLFLKDFTNRHSIYE